MIAPRANLAITAIAIFMATSFAHAFSPAPALDPILKDLASEDPIVREAASQKLTDSGVANLRTLFDVMKQQPLSLEQRKRLEAAARPLFESSPRAGLGVSFDRTIDDGSVRIIGTVEGPGFHAHEFLKSGDVVRELDGIPVHTQEQARSVILSHDPADIMDVMVIRQGTPIRAAIRLGRFEDLEANRGFAGGRSLTWTRDLQSALRVRMLRELGDQAEQSGAPPVDAGLNNESWDVLFRKIHAQNTRRIEKEGRDSQATVPSLTVGGTGRIALVDATHQSPKRYDARFPNMDRQTLQDAIVQKKAQLQQIQNIADALKLRLQQPGINARDQNLAREQLDQVRQMITDIEGRIREDERRLNGR